MQPLRPGACTSPRRLFAALLVFIACGQTAAAAAPQAEPAAQSWDRIGVGTHLVWSSESEARAVFERARSGGVEWVREDFPWGTLEPSRGSYDWTRTDALMAAAAASGVQVLGILDYSARWASSDPSGAGEEHFAPRDPADYAEFAAAVVNRYGRDGSFWSTRPELTPRPLAALEIWNEPYAFWFWKPAPDPAVYARLAHAAAVAINATHPEVKILISGEAWQARRDDAAVPWLGQVLDADPALPKLVDAYSIHPYPWPRNRGPYDTSNRWNFGQVERSREIAEARHAALPIWITEIGWSTAANLPEDAVSEETQATYVRQALERAFGEWGTYVDRMFFYSFDRSTADAGDREGNYGLRRADNSLKPAWDEITRFIGAAANGRLPILRARIVVNSKVFSKKLILRGRIVPLQSPGAAAKRRVLLFRYTRGDWRVFAEVRTNRAGGFKLARRVRPSVRRLHLVALVRYGHATIKSPVVTIRRR